MGATWYLIFSKKGHRFTVLISLALFGGVLIFLLRAMRWVEVGYINQLFWGKSIGIWYFCAGASLASALYMVRFYMKPVQDIFSIIKLLIVLLSTILLGVNVFFIEDQKIITFSVTTILFLLLILTILHITDMIIWERKNLNEISELNTLDNMIEEISGKKYS